MTVNKKTGKKKSGRRKPRRRVRWWLLVPVAMVIAAIVYLATMPYRNDNEKLANLGYDKETIALIREKELLHLILDNGYYSDQLAQAIKDGTLRTDYIDLYTCLPKRSPEALDFLICRRLADEGYENDQIVNLFHSLEQKELIPLLVYDYQWDEISYINDVIGCRKSGHFDLSSDYRQMCKVTSKADEPDSLQVLVNRRNYLEADYVPSDLKTISDEFAINGCQLRKEAADAAVRMIQAAQNNGIYFFVSDAYWDYDSLVELNDRLLTYMTEVEVDVSLAKPGFNEHQTGLALNFAPTFENEDNFRLTEAYKWLKEHSASYGFVERFPQYKEAITGRETEPAHFRYVGKNTAMAVKESGLTYDEFYNLYLKDWDNPELEPSQSILSDIEWYQITD